MMTERKFTKYLQGAIHFVFQRQKQDGGFGATPKLPATLEDSYHAIRIIEMVSGYCGLSEGYELDTNLHGSFLRSFLAQEPELGLKGLYQLIWCMDRCGLRDYALEVAQKRLPAFECNSTPSAYYLIRISRLVGKDHMKIDLSKEKVRGVISFSGILLKRWMYIYTSISLGIECHTRQVSEWVKDCQNYDGGFGFLPGTTSYLENSHYALCALDMLGQSPKNVGNATKYVLSCQRKSGGFSRKADAAPFLESTYHGVAALVQLDKLPAP